MNVQVTHVIVHDPAQVRAIIREAHAIASELEDDNLTYGRVFDQACRLLGQRYTLAAANDPLQMPSMALPGNMGRH